MSYRGTPYYDMALDAGYRGEEADQMAANIEYDHMRYAQGPTGRDENVRELVLALARVLAMPMITDHLASCDPEIGPCPVRKAISLLAGYGLPDWKERP